MPWILGTRERNEGVPRNEKERRQTLDFGRSEDWESFQIGLCALDENEKTGATCVSYSHFSPKGLYTYIL